MLYARDFRLRARQALAGNWKIAVLVTLVAVLLGAGGGGPNINFNINADSNWLNSIFPHFTVELGGYPHLLLAWGWLRFTLALFWLPLIAILFCTIGGVAELGLVRYHTLLVAGQEQDGFGTLFAPFRYWLKAFGLRFMTSLLTALWALLLVIPGLIASYRYAMAPYILAEDPSMGVMEAIERSKQMMDGNKWRLLCLQLSFIGWIILGALTWGISMLWVTPYQYAAEAAFYLELSGQLPGVWIEE